MFNFTPAKKTADSSSLKATVKDQTGMGKWRIGELLKKQGYITAKQLDQAVDLQKKNGGLLSSILLRLGFVEDDTIVNFLARHQNFPIASLAQEKPAAEALQVLPFALAKKYMAMPLQLRGANLRVAMAEPTDGAMLENLKVETKCTLSVCVAAEKEIVEAFRAHYAISDAEYAALLYKKEGEEEEQTSFSIDDFGSLASEAAEGLEIEDDAASGPKAEQYSANDAPIIKLVNGILLKAVTEGISDIHIEPYETSLQVRYRLDGALYRTMNLPLEIKNALVSRVKILASLNITERRVPQDGRIRIRLGKHKAIDFRVSTLPTLFGERIVLRILDKSSLQVDLTKLGFEADAYAAVERCLYRPQGLILVTGPTGSGKTVTLYSMLNALNNEESNIMTAEDPVEFNFRGINQVNVITEVGMTFAAALKAFLRQDPDIIMVGEIRDIETAEIAIKAAMTGHQVLSTLHTNDSIATVGRLVNIGIPPYMLTSALTLVMAQRLGRRLCPECKTPLGPVEHDKLLAMGFQKGELDSLKLFGPNGCPKCKGGGYKGRIGFFEVLEVTEPIAKAINAKLPEEQLRKVAIKEGMKTLRMAALQKARVGLTSIDEVLRRTVPTEEILPAFLVNPEVEEYEDGEVITRQGSKDHDFFKLIRGTVELVKDGQVISEISEIEEIFGEMEAICNEPRAMSVISRGRSVVKRFPGDKLMDIIASQPEISKQLFKTISSRLSLANEKIAKLVEQNSDLAATRAERSAPLPQAVAKSVGSAPPASQPRSVTPIPAKVMADFNALPVFDLAAQLRR